MEPIQIYPKTFLHEHCALPALQAAVSRIQEIILSEKADINRIAELIATDPSLVVQVLKIVNSAYYGLSRVISDVKSAVAYIGLSEVYGIVLAIAVVKKLSVEKSEKLDCIRQACLFKILPPALYHHECVQSEKRLPF